MTVDVSEIPLLREPIDRAREAGRHEGMAEMVARLLIVRFPNALPTDFDLKEHLRGLRAEILLGIIDMGVKAVSMEEALGRHMPTIRSDSGAT